MGKRTAGDDLMIVMEPYLEELLYIGVEQKGWKVLRDGLQPCGLNSQRSTLTQSMERIYSASNDEEDTYSTKQYTRRESWEKDEKRDITLVSHIWPKQNSGAFAVPLQSSALVICDSRALCHFFQSFSSTSTIYTKVGRISSLYQAMTLLKFSRNLCPYDDRERRLQCAGFNEFRSNSKPPSDSLGSLANVKREYSVEEDVAATSSSTLYTWRLQGLVGTLGWLIQVSTCPSAIEGASWMAPRPSV